MPVMNLILLVSVVFLLSCEDDTEPNVDFCTIGPFELGCNPTEPGKENYTKSFDEAIGYQAVSTRHFGDLEAHHQDLHQQLDQCK